MFINRLKEYKDATGISWREMDRLTGISSAFLVLVSKYDNEEDIRKISLKNYLIIKEKLGVDLLS